ncbi:DUF3892 domain-containing protein [Xanthomonas campestris pv. campestris]|nr:DUF3892 domain-containing protein [Xanthomonas campestris pv. campestris]
MKNPDFFVSAVKYRSDGSHVASLRVHKVDKASGKFGPSSHIDMTRPQVIESFGQMMTFITIVRKADGIWAREAALEIISVKKINSRPCEMNPRATI